MFIRLDSGVELMWMFNVCLLILVWEPVLFSLPRLVHLVVIGLQVVDGYVRGAILECVLHPSTLVIVFVDLGVVIIDTWGPMHCLVLKLEWVLCHRRL